MIPTQQKLHSLVKEANVKKQLAHNVICYSKTMYKFMHMGHLYLGLCLYKLEPQAKNQSNV